MSNKEHRRLFDANAYDFYDAVIKSELRSKAQGFFDQFMAWGVEPTPISLRTFERVGELQRRHLTLLPNTYSTEVTVAHGWVLHDRDDLVFGHELLVLTSKRQRLIKFTGRTEFFSDSDAPYTIGVDVEDILSVLPRTGGYAHIEDLDDAHSVVGKFDDAFSPIVDAIIEAHVVAEHNALPTVE